MRRSILAPLTILTVIANVACSDDSSNSETTGTTETETGNTASGDGDGDSDGTETSGTASGDGDGDGDPATGDGDGDPATGDGDGDAEGVCGDGAVDENEECDDGNPDDTDACTSNCFNAFCGDGFVEAGVEGCDDGNNVDGDGCSSTCEIDTCGDGVLDEGELCDDGNLDDTDACTSLCVTAACGDGFIQDMVEVCDDGNLEDTDACTSLCMPAACGDGFIQDMVEVCDDGNLDDTDNCVAGCVVASCGDGFIEAGVEDCDDANDVDDDGCDNACVGTTDYVFLTSANGSAGFHRYSILDDAWDTVASPPSTTHSQLTNDGTSVFLMGSNNTVYEYDTGNDSWSDLMTGPGNLTSSPIGLFQWFSDGFYYLNDGQSTLYVYRDGAWSNLALESGGSSAGTWDAQAQELYIRTYSQLGFQVVDTTTDTVTRTIVDATNVGENSRSGSFANGFFYTRIWDGAFQRFDGIDGTKTGMTGDPTSSHTGTDTDFLSGRIYVSGYSNLATVFQVYDPDNDVMIDLAASPNVSNHSTVTVMRF